MYSVESMNLSKVYKTSFGRRKVNALNDFNLMVEEGTIFGLLGPNGAGKTTFIKILLGITFATGGEAKILGKNLNDYDVKKKIGYLPENHKYPNYLTGENVLKYFAQLSGCDEKNINKRIDYLLEMVKLSQWRKMKVKAYSKGMMQRLGLAQALINDPELIFLDEPTDGVDPIGRKEIRDILAELKMQKKTIFLNSHLLSEVELVTDRVAILNKGKLLKEATVKELTETAENYIITFDNITDDFATLQNSESKQLNKNEYLIKTKNIDELNQLIDSIRQKNVLIKSIVPQKNSLEDYFINLIKQSEMDGGQI